MKTKLLLFTKWGITFEEPYRMEEQINRTVYYADRERLQKSISLSCTEEESEYFIFSQISWK